jgi:hypothetical protein
MDGFGLTVEYQRWPLKWNQAYKNLQKLDEYAQKNPNILAWLACTVTAYNVWHVPLFMKWKLQSSGFVKINSTKKRPIITHHVAHGPRRVNIRILTPELKQELVEHYERFIEEFKKEYPEEIAKNAESILRGIIKYAQGADYSDKLPEFVKFTKYLDAARGNNILDIAPEYKGLFE